jgi:dephospho-CoA kinase
MIIGIIGRGGSGKSVVHHAVSPLFQNELDLDIVGHEVLTDQTVMAKIRDKFGDDVFENNRVNRSVLGKQVFASANCRQTLNDIVHPHITTRCRAWALAHQNESDHALGHHGLIVGALMIQLGLNHVCDVMVTVDADTDEILKHQPHYLPILNSQPSRKWYRQHADIIIENTWSDSFRDQCIAVFKKVLNT